MKEICDEYICRGYLSRLSIYKRKSNQGLISRENITEFYYIEDNINKCVLSSSDSKINTGKKDSNQKKYITDEDTFPLKDML